ncbi:FAD-dependent oxidoreductase [Membranicola marinus]|uniref:FAD-dependent oxidoreductase n=1 Tax=Membranihabitans marinus TaxID=1227546 RepID=A0A953LCG5_9BACT|nr:FAD-dependent oxidoreductase [Membranihabitans marinus]MBY5959486.1 FAD-dependent oxidoreductase [Membranihabitans marinus]
MMKPFLIVFSMLIIEFVSAQSFLIEAESFDEKGGWLVDPQFVEQMGSPYLLAHGLGTPVENATMEVNFPQRGTYHVWVRTKNWVPGNWEAPGRFQLKVGNQILDKEFGVTPGWSWEYGGDVDIRNPKASVELIDLTGFEGRCDAIYFSTENAAPPAGGKELAKWRAEVTNQKNAPEQSKSYDYVVVGGGIAGCANAIAAAEQGLKVALIHDRPVLGGNASSEIRVHTLGIYGYFERILKMLDTKHYPNGSPEAYAEDQKRHKNMEKYDNIDLYLNWRAYDANTDGNTITSVDARHTSSGERIRFEAPLFADCTGDGWIGFWAGAEFMYGRESVDEFDEGWDEFGELWSPEEPDGAVMGSSVLWRVYRDDKKNIFPEVPWAMDVVGDHAAKHGEWYWEYSNADVHQIHDAEQIRDHMFRAIYGSFANEKKKPGTENLQFEWISYLVGKRESRRLVGDYIFTFNDAKNSREFEDGVVQETREVDVHFQKNLKDPEKPDFLSTAMFYKTGKYYIPYRSLYSKNIDNLFMAGRNFSCSHIGLGGPRVMRTTGQMGASVGLAASVCNKYDINPRQVYEQHLDEYMDLVRSSTKMSQEVE